MQETNVFFTKIRTETDGKTPPMQYANGDISSVILLVISSPSNSRDHASNITCPRIEYHMPKVTVE